MLDNRCVPLCQRIAERPNEGPSGVNDAHTELNQLVVPNRECCFDRARPRVESSGFQQSCTLPNHSVVIRKHSGEYRVSRGNRLVEKSPPRRRVTLHERKILRGKDDAAEPARQFPRPNCILIYLGPIRLVSIELHFEQHVAVFDRNFHARNGSRRSGPHHGGITANPVRAQARKVGDCLDEVRLALPVSSDNEIRAGFEGNLGNLVVTKFTEG